VGVADWRGYNNLVNVGTTDRNDHIVSSATVRCISKVNDWLRTRILRERDDTPTPERGRQKVSE